MSISGIPIGPPELLELDEASSVVDELDEASAVVDELDDSSVLGSVVSGAVVDDDDVPVEPVVSSLAVPPDPPSSLHPTSAAASATADPSERKRIEIMSPQPWRAKSPRVDSITLPSRHAVLA
jgi:hypothetical protein